MIYTLIVEKAGSRIYSHDIVLAEEFSFPDQVQDALRVFHLNFPQVSLADDDVRFAIEKRP